MKLYLYEQEMYRSFRFCFDPLKSVSAQIPQKNPGEGRIIFVHPAMNTQTPDSDNCCPIACKGMPSSTKLQTGRPCRKGTSQRPGREATTKRRCRGPRGMGAPPTMTCRLAAASPANVHQMPGGARCPQGPIRAAIGMLYSCDWQTML
jgi:hypothetical protein